MVRLILRTPGAQESAALPPAARAWLAAERPAAFAARDGCALLWFLWPHAGGARPMRLALTRSDLFFVCETPADADALRALLPQAAGSGPAALRAFFAALLADDEERLDALEQRLDSAEDAVLAGRARGGPVRLAALRRELFALRRYYVRLGVVLDGLDDGPLLTEAERAALAPVRRRAARCADAAHLLQERAAALRESWQTQLDLEENALMRLFTLLTALFLPLTLLTGWYGMNFAAMPELRAPYAYPVFIAVCAALTLGLLAWFRRRHWL